MFSWLCGNSGIARRLVFIRFFFFLEAVVKKASSNIFVSGSPSSASSRTNRTPVKFSLSASAKKNMSTRPLFPPTVAASGRVPQVPPPDLPQGPADDSSPQGGGAEDPNDVLLIGSAVPEDNTSAPASDEDDVLNPVWQKRGPVGGDASAPAVGARDDVPPLPLASDQQICGSAPPGSPDLDEPQPQSSPASPSAPPPVLPPKPVYPSASGLDNMGNTCYMNSVLQVLYNCPGFASSLSNFVGLLADTYPKEAGLPDEKESTPTNKDLDTTQPMDIDFDATPPSRSGTPMPITATETPNFNVHLPMNLAYTFKNMAHNAAAQKLDEDRSKSCNPKALINNFGLVNDRFAGRNQEDCQEFLRFVLGYLQDFGADLIRARIEQEKKRDNERQLSHQILGYGGADQFHSSAHADYATPKSSFIESPTKRRKIEELSPPEITIPDVDKAALSFVERIFQGKYSSGIKCIECECANLRDEPFLDLSVDIEAGKPLSWSFDRITAREWLNRQDKYKCDECLTYVEACRQVRLKSLPPILTIHMKRFKWGDGQWPEKISDKVQCPLELTMEPQWLAKGEPPCKYELFGVVFHLGASLNFGHYVSYVKASTAVQAKELPVFGDDLTVHRIATVGNQQTVVEEANSTKAAVIGSSDVSMTDGEPKQDDGMDLDATINKDEPDRSKEWIYFDDEDTNFVSHEAFMSAMFPEVPTPRTPYILFYSKVEQ